MKPPKCMKQPKRKAATMLCASDSQPFLSAASLGLEL